LEERMDAADLREWAWARIEEEKAAIVTEAVKSHACQRNSLHLEEGRAAARTLTGDLRDAGDDLQSIRASASLCSWGQASEAELRAWEPTASQLRDVYEDVMIALVAVREVEAHGGGFGLGYRRVLAEPILRQESLPLAEAIGLA
jgi:hypothetical protein